MTHGLEGRVVVLSPHLDDAVLSLGAAMAGAVRRGADVTVITVFAGDPESNVPAGPWDALCGFRTFGEAARARRIEDRRALEIIGCRSVWLPFPDEQYEGRPERDELWRAIGQHLDSPDAVLAPGFPVTQPDHTLLSRLALQHDVPARRFGLYVDQPYPVLRPKWQPSGWMWEPRLEPDLASLVEAVPRWGVVRSAARDRMTKWRAARKYRSQLRRIGRRPPILMRVRLYESRRGGETIGWI